MHDFSWRQKFKRRLTRRHPRGNRLPGSWSWCQKKSKFDHVSMFRSDIVGLIHDSIMKHDRSVTENRKKTGGAMDAPWAKSRCAGSILFLSRTFVAHPKLRKILVQKITCHIHLQFCIYMGFICVLYVLYMCFIQFQWIMFQTFRGVHHAITVHVGFQV
jgi:hypothetical protein